MLESSPVSLGVQQPQEPLPRWPVLLEAGHDECRRCGNAGLLQEEPTEAHGRQAVARLQKKSLESHGHLAVARPQEERGG